MLANALSHRPYTTRGDIFIRLYPDRLEIQNPGLLPLGVTAQHGLLKATDFARLLDLPDETRVRSWLGSLLDKEIIFSRGRTRATEYLVNPEWLRLLHNKGTTTLKKIAPHRLRHLVIEDLQTYSPDETTASSLSEIHRRIGPEIHIRKLRHAIDQMRQADVIRHNGRRGVGSRYFIRQKSGK